MISFQDDIIDRLEIKAFRAVDFPDYCQEYIIGHKKVLTDLGIKKLTSAKSTWPDNKYCYVLGIWSKKLNRLVSGARIEVAVNQLPIEDAIGVVDKSIFELVRSDQDNYGTAELCGLWTDIEYSGRGIAMILIKNSVSILSMIDIPILYILCAESTFNMFEKVGCKVLTSVGNNGTFFYPKLNLIATALKLPDTLTLDYANHECKEKIFYLRENLKGCIIENGPKGNLAVSYELGNILNWKNITT